MECWKFHDYNAAVGETLSTLEDVDIFTVINLPVVWVYAFILI